MSATTVARINTIVTANTTQFTAAMGALKAKAAIIDKPGSLPPPPVLRRRRRPVRSPSASSVQALPTRNWPWTSMTQ